MSARAVACFGRRAAQNEAETDLRGHLNLRVIVVGRTNLEVHPYWMRDVTGQNIDRSAHRIKLFTFSASRYHRRMDAILSKFRAALTELYGERIERVVLFGSRARGDAKRDSDYDVALFLKEPTDTWEEIDRLTNLQLAMRDDMGVDIHTMPFRAGHWRDPASPLMFEIRKDGLDL